MRAVIARSRGISRAPSISIRTSVRGRAGVGLSPVTSPSSSGQPVNPLGLNPTMSAVAFLLPLGAANQQLSPDTTRPERTASKLPMPVVTAVPGRNMRHAGSDAGWSLTRPDAPRFTALCAAPCRAPMSACSGAGRRCATGGSGCSPRAARSSRPRRTQRAGADHQTRLSAQTPMLKQRRATLHSFRSNGSHFRGLQRQSPI